MVPAELPILAVYLAVPHHSSPRPWCLPAAPVHLPAPDHRPDFQPQALMARPLLLRQCPVPQAAHLPLLPCSGLLTHHSAAMLPSPAETPGRGETGTQADLSGIGGQGLPQDRQWGPETLSRCTPSASCSVHTTKLFLIFILYIWLHQVLAVTCKLLVATCGISFPDQGLNLGPCIGPPGSLLPHNVILQWGRTLCV